MLSTEYPTSTLPPIVSATTRRLHEYDRIGHCKSNSRDYCLNRAQSGLADFVD